MEPAVARTGRLDKIRNLLDEIRRYYDKIMVKISNRLVTACRLTSVTRKEGEEINRIVNENCGTVAHKEYFLAVQFAGVQT